MSDYIFKKEERKNCIDTEIHALIDDEVTVDFIIGVWTKNVNSKCLS